MCSRNPGSSGEKIFWAGSENDIVRPGRVADFSQLSLLHKVGVWIALGICALADVAVGLPLILGMDVHFGALGFITLQSLWSPLGLAIVGGFVVVQAVLVMRFIRLKSS
jgi:hypothetical protein